MKNDHSDESAPLLEPARDDLTLDAVPDKRAVLTRTENSVSAPLEKMRKALNQEEYQDEDVDPNPTFYEKSSIFGALHYAHAIRHICKLRKKRIQPLTLEDAPRIGKTEEVYHKILELETEYKSYREKHKTPSLFWPLLKVFWLGIFAEQMSEIFYCTAKILFALFLSKILEMLEAGQREEAYIWAAWLLAAIIISVYANHFGYFQGYRLAGQIRMTLTGLMYRKITKLTSYAVNQVSIGKIVNIVANDLNMLESQIPYLPYLVAFPFIFAASLAILWSLVGAASITGMAFLLLNTPIQFYLARIGARLVGKKNLVTDERIKLTNELIEGIRLLKMSGWNTQYAQSILKTRTQEVALLTKIGYCDYFGGHLLMRIAPAMGSFLIFITYGLMGGNLTASKVYSTIILLIFLQNAAILYFSMALRLLSEMKLTFNRIIQLLEAEEYEISQLKAVNRPLDDRNGVEFDNFSAFWEKKATLDSSYQSFATPTLKNVNFSVKRGTLCALIGRVGSGKTTTLLSFLNEIPKTTGNLRYSGSIAYVEQEPSIYSETFRNNILFGRPYDEGRYNQVLEATCLIEDIKEFPSGDMIEIGERGINLSGGQKARTSLARALYSNADIYLLDDPLSAVDNKTAQSIFEKAIRGLLMNKTVLLATHQVHFAKEAEKIVVLENGEIKSEGTLNEIIRHDTTIMTIFESIGGFTKKNAKREHSTLSSQDSLNDLKSDLEDKDEDDNQALIDEIPKTEKENDNKGKLIMPEKDESGRVGWRTYQFYIQNAGSFCFIISFILNLAGIEVLYVGYTRSLGYWTEGTWTAIFTMKILGIIIAAFFLFLILREVLLVNSGLNASKKFHNKMLQSVAGAKVEFFDTNTSGRILNRFSNDVGVLDRFLLLVQSSVLDAMFFYVSLFTTVCVIVPWLIIPATILTLPLLILFNGLKKYITQGRGLELLTRSPVYSLFSLTLSGLSSIRVYGQEKRFIRDFTRLLNRNIRAYNFYYNSNVLFMFYCNLLGGIFACVGILILLSIDNVDNSLIGLTACYLLSIIDSIQYVIRQSLTHAMQMASTARIKAYIETEQEPVATLPSDEFLNSWPSKGELQFNNVYVKYRENTEHILKGLTFSVNSTEKIGCVGRTGAGKSSIIQALFRMVEIDKQTAPDSSITIDGIDISKVGLQTLRKSISIIPQIPFTFTGTVRKNLDPLEEHEDHELITALQETDLWDHVRSFPDNLNTQLSSTSSLFSTGQKQLLCLARVFLQNNKILILDEATSNVDFETDNFIQRKIMESFRESTVFVIAHRLSTVAHYDKVMVMDRGLVKELDHPYKLLVKNIGDESITNSDGLFASIVQHTETKHSESIFQAARSSYFEKRMK